MTPPEATHTERRAGGFDASSPVVAVRRHGPAFAGWLLPFLLVLYLALKQGGYDGVIRGEVGIAVWWIVLVGAAVGVLPSVRIGRSGWTAIGVLAGFALWTGLGIGWSESAERSVGELGRVAMLLGVFVLALSTQGRGAAHRTLAAVASAAAVVGALAVLSRMEPNLLPVENIVSFLPSTENRLSYPLGYWNGLAHLMALGLPLVVWLASAARLTVVRAVSAAAIPLMALAGYLTLSRGGMAAAAVAMIVLVAIYPSRMRLLPAIGLGTIGSALLISAAAQRGDFQDGVISSVAVSQGSEMLAMAVIVCGGVGLLHAAYSLADRHGLGPRIPRPSPLGTGIAAGSIALVALCIALAAGAPTELDNAWQQFKEPNTAGSGVERLQSTSGSNRYQYWQSTLDANATSPMLGIGPGTYEFWWARDNPLEHSTSFFVRDAHSLYLEALAEVGIVGFLLITGFIVFVIAYGAVRAFRRRTGPAAGLAAAVAGAAAFATSAAVDWAWELTILPVCFLLLAAVIFGRDTDPDEADVPAAAKPSPGLRGGLAAVAAVALVAIMIPLAGLSAVEESQAEARSDSLEQALVDAKTASSVQPYAATPHLQEALVLERGKQYAAAADAATQATEEEPTNWRPWIILSRIEAARGNTEASIEAFRQARSLNPRSPLFAQ